MTLRCSACGFENDDDVTRCELCGADLQRSFAANPYDHPHRVPTGLKPLPPKAAEAGDTDVGLGGVQPRRPKQARIGTSDTLDRIDSLSAKGEGSKPSPLSEEDAAGESESLRGRVKLVVEQGRIIGEQYLLTEPRMVIGRSDPSAAIYPDIDLTAQDNEYVHRRHALLQFYDLATRLSVEHVGGHNPTLVNNIPLIKGELVELKLGDRLRVGRVVMRLKNASSR